jgi:hypothetical protein
MKQRMRSHEVLDRRDCTPDVDGVQVDHRGARAGMTHAEHQLAEVAGYLADVIEHLLPQSLPCREDWMSASAP